MIALEDCDLFEVSNHLDAVVRIEHAYEWADHARAQRCWPRRSPALTAWWLTTRRMIVTTESLGPAIAAEAPDVLVLGEPQGRNTAPCLYRAARLIAERDPTTVMVVMSAAHVVDEVRKRRPELA